MNEEVVFLRSNSHRAEDNNEIVIASNQLGLTGNLQSDVIVREPTGTEDRELLSPDQRSTCVNCRNSGLDE